jgi:hypothetical protein
MTEAQLLADLATISGILSVSGDSMVARAEDGKFETKMTVEVMWVGLSELNKRPIEFTESVKYSVYKRGQVGLESAYYEDKEPINPVAKDVTISVSSYQAIANLYNSTVLQDRVLAAVMSMCSSVFQESTTSTTSLTIGTGSQSLTVTTGYPTGTVIYNWGQQLIISNGSNTMTGYVTSYTQATGALVINITSVTGSGTFSSWSIIPTYHSTRLKLVAAANQNMYLTVMQFMSSVALNTTVQSQGTSVTDATLFSIVSGVWDAFAGLTVA